ncbi:MAG: cytochrome c peroxidase [Pseudomonadota bacterium]
MMGRRWRWVRGAGWLSAALVVTLSPGCDDGLAPSPPPTLDLVTDVVPVGFPAGSPIDRAPAENALTEARAQLGKRLFFDPVLSRTGAISCSTCHLPERAFADPNPVSTGVDDLLGTRNAPALVNLAWSDTFFWDGRAATLEEQAGKPIENPVEMDLPLADAVDRVAADGDYARAFADAYVGPPSADHLRMAIASFVRTLVSHNSPYDHHLAGQDDPAFGVAEQRGEALFLDERTGCFHCHPTGLLTNDGFFNNGSYVDGGDVGRRMVTGRTGDLGKFKVPGLRNVAVSAPYMHDGSLATLEDVVAQYVRGGRGHPTTDPQIRPLSLSPDEQADLLSFLRSLTDASFLSDPRWRP